MWKKAYLCRFIAILTFTALYSAIALHGIRGYVVYLTDKRQSDVNVTVLRPIFLSSKFFIDVQSSPVYEIVYICQLIVSFANINSYVSFDCFFVFTILHLSGQLINLQNQIENLLIEKVRRNCQMKDLLVPIIYRHQRITR